MAAEAHQRDLSGVWVQRAHFSIFPMSLKLVRNVAAPEIDSPSQSPIIFLITQKGKLCTKEPLQDVVILTNSVVKATISMWKIIRPGRIQPQSMLRCRRHSGNALRSE